MVSGALDFIRRYLRLLSPSDTHCGQYTLLPP
jgi:hypothetical protein